MSRNSCNPSPEVVYEPWGLMASNGVFPEREMSEGEKELLNGVHDELRPPAVGAVGNNNE